MWLFNFSSRVVGVVKFCAKPPRQAERGRIRQEMRFLGYRSLGRLAMAGGPLSEESHALKVLEGDREGSPGLCLIKLLQSSCDSLGGSLK